MDSDKPNGQDASATADSVGAKAGAGRPTATQVGLAVVLTLVFASIGSMMMLLTLASAWYLTGWRGLLGRLVSLNTIGFVAICPVLCGLAVRVIRRVGAQRGWDQPTVQLCVFAALMLVVTVSAFAAWGSGALLLLHFAWGGLVPLGIGFVTHGLTRRVGEDLSCAQCNYAYDEGLEICPECGAHWNERGGVRSGRLERSRAFVGVGAALLVMSVVLVIRPLGAQLLSPILPTRLLIAQTSSAEFWSARGWAELAQRSLSPQQVQELADGLLTRRWAAGRLDSEPTAWLEQQIAAGALQDRIVERFFREMVVMHMRGPKAASVGEPVRVEVFVDDRSTPFAGIGARIVFAGFSIDGEPVEGSRRERLMSVYELSERLTRRRAGASLPSVVFDRQQAGTVTVEAEAWIIYGPEAALGWGVAWQDDGAPALPAGVLWREHVRLKQEVEIRPGDAALRRRP
ncbi:MAG: hypothetical protein Kow0022_17990 [Phycisphaerales bacterium]